MIRPALALVSAFAETSDSTTERGAEVRKSDREQVEAHLGWMRHRNLARSTITQRTYALRRFSRWLGNDGPALLEVTTEQILAFRDRLTRARQPLTPESQASELSHLGGFYRWAELEGLLHRNPMLRVPRPKLPRGLPRPISEADLELAVSSAPLRIRPWLLLAAFAGLRACEIAPLRGEDIWWHADPSLIVIRAGKGGDAGTVALAPELEGELRTLPRRGWLFPRLDGGMGPTPAHRVSQLANKHLHRLGLPDTLHSLRHRFGTQVYRLSGRDIRLTQEMMRHRSPVSTAIYTAVDLTESAGVVASLPSVRRLRAV